jgi:hypothetical protein
LGRGCWGFSWGLKERDVGGSNGGGGGGVERAAASWWRGRQCGGKGSGLEAKGFQHERERERERERVREREREAFVFCIFNFIYLTNLTVKLLF